MSCWGVLVCSDDSVTTLGIRNEVRELPKEIRVEEYKMQNHLKEAEISRSVEVVIGGEYIFLRETFFFLTSMCMFRVRLDHL